jgi:manganese efflux pump family protein
VGIAALILWLLSAVGGFVLLGTWIAKGGAKQTSSSHLPPLVVFGHFLLAAVGLVLWIVYLVIDNDAVGWVAFALLVPVALLGLLMFLRWLPTFRARANAAESSDPAERHFPVGIVLGHGVFAVATVVLALLADLNV